ncbi:MAG: hypothetical protein ACLGI3_16855 [Actinomycetes bacterium]
MTTQPHPFAVAFAAAQEDFPSDPPAGTPLESSSTGNPPAVAPVGPIRRLQLTEPVRLWLYPVVVALVGLLVAYGQVSADVAPLWEALAAAVLATGGPVVVERVRANVFSPRTATLDALAAGRAGAAAERERALSITMRAAVAARSERFPL